MAASKTPIRLYDETFTVEKQDPDDKKFDKGGVADNRRNPCQIFSDKRISERLPRVSQSLDSSASGALMQSFSWT